MLKIKNSIPYIISILLPLFFLIPVQLMLDKPMILAERFVEYGGWIEIFVLEIYCFFLTKLMIKPSNIIKWRTRYWLFFSIIFFTQFILGLFVNQQFLMTGKLHLPIPALIIAGPLFRGSGFFMIILLLSTILLAGPAWCSHLCYIGAWDNWAAKKQKQIKFISRKNTIITRYIVVFLVVIVTLILRFLNLNFNIAITIAIAFGILGIVSMIFISRRKGYMFHCTTYCPIGGIVVFLGKIFPIRVRINTSTCTLCNKCSNDCKYEALNVEDIKKGKAAWNCTLCGDCLNSCKHNSIRFSFFGKQANFWEIYIALIISLHTVFIALARL